jgi:hypothetical protein
MSKIGTPALATHYSSGFWISRGRQISSLELVFQIQCSVANQRCIERNRWYRACTSRKLNIFIAKGGLSHARRRSNDEER